MGNVSSTSSQSQPVKTQQASPPSQPKELEKAKQKQTVEGTPAAAPGTHDTSKVSAQKGSAAKILDFVQKAIFVTPPTQEEIAWALNLERNPTNATAQDLARYDDIAHRLKATMETKPPK